MSSFQALYKKEQKRNKLSQMIMFFVWQYMPSIFLYQSSNVITACVKLQC